MYLTEYQKISVDNFMGLWNRGSLDDVPPDHASDIQNMAFARKREVVTRPGASFSRNLPSGANIVRIFDAAFDNNTLIPLACDGVGNIWRMDNTTAPLLTLSTMIDFSALNMNNHVYIAPIMDGTFFDPTDQCVYVWESPAVAVRPAAGLRPPPLLNVTEAAGGGNVGPGYYGAAVAWVFDTGYVSPPGPVIVNPVAFSGTHPMEFFGIPGTNATPPRPPGVVGYLLLSTKAQNTAADAARAALYEVATSLDITSSVISVNFFDTDLTILASNDPVNGNLYNSMSRLPCGFGPGSVALIKYHNRMIIIGPNLVYPPNWNPSNSTTPQPAPVNDGRIFISSPGAPENFDVLTGYLVVDPEFDGNIVRTGFELFGVLYVCKAVGTFASQDNQSAPNDPTNPWIVNRIDGAIGAYHHAVGTITASQPGLSFNSTAFLANRNGLFLFNGNVLRPELSWKIRALWAQMTVNMEYQIRVTIDAYNDIFYVLLPITASGLPSYVVLAGDYSLGLDSTNIRWSIYEFPWGVFDLVMAAYPDQHNLSYYYLRLGSSGIIYKLDGFNTWDEVWQGGSGQYVRNNPIDCYYQSAPFILGDVGSLNILRFIRYRMAGQGTLFTTITDQGESQFVQTVTVSPDPFPGNYRDIGLQTNFTNEKVITKFQMNGLNDYLRMARFDVFGKQRWPTRPNG